MKFKVGDKVVCKDAKKWEGYLEEGAIYCILVSTEGSVRVRPDDGNRLTEFWDSTWFWDSRFELAEQPKPVAPQIDDIWANESKSMIVKVVSFIPKRREKIGFIYVKECVPVIEKGEPSSLEIDSFLELFPDLLQRKPKKQSKPVVETPKKQKEEKWDPVVDLWVNPQECFRKGNKIKWVTHGIYEGIATCHKNDKFDLNYGIALAWCRAQIKYYEAMVAEKLKEGAK